MKNSESTCFVVQCLDLRNELVDEVNIRIEVIRQKFLDIFIERPKHANRCLLFEFLDPFDDVVDAPLLPDDDGAHRNHDNFLAV